MLKSNSPYSKLYCMWNWNVKIKFWIITNYYKNGFYIAPNASVFVLNSPKSLSVGTPPQIPLGELAALTQTPYIAVWEWDRNLLNYVYLLVTVDSCFVWRNTIIWMSKKWQSRKYFWGSVVRTARLCRLGMRMYICYMRYWIISASRVS